MKTSNRRHSGRRSIAIAAVAAAVIAIVPVQAAVAAPHSNPDPVSPKSLTIILEHGAWADGSSWSAVQARLESEGYKVLVPPNELRGLKNDSDYLASFIKNATTGPVLLVGHSYGGAVITDAGLSDPDVKGLVYVDAFAPAEGESLGAILAPSTSALNPPASPYNVLPIVGDTTGQNGDVYLKPETVRDVFAQDLSRQQQALITAEQRPVELSTFGETGSAPAYASLPSWYVVGTEDRAIPESTQLMMAKRAGAQIFYVKASHVSLISKPAFVASVIEKAAGSIK
jgi:pimeloyl-ACP methyl ester carboxylesterase